MFAAFGVFILYVARLIPIKPWKTLINKGIDFIPPQWIKNNDCIKQFTSKTQFEVHMPESINLNEFYAVTANHQSWADILILFSAFNERIPMLKFFWKKQLWWFPLVGLLCWIYDFPVMHRHNKDQLKKHPEWKGRDLAATRKACERFKHKPGSLMIFAEGTRFTPVKQHRQNSPYHHLLKPKAGGIAFGLQCMDNLIKTLLDVTIIYPLHQNTFWQFCCGKSKKIIINVREIPITPELQGDYLNNPEFRAQFQRFINQVWAEKDEVLDKR
jgi:1-acyl-sn-glycerol-3-phosphate acyltransferase